MTNRWVWRLKAVGSGIAELAQVRDRRTQFADTEHEAVQALPALIEKLQVLARHEVVGVQGSDELQATVERDVDVLRGAGNRGIAQPLELDAEQSRGLVDVSFKIFRPNDPNDVIDTIPRDFHRVSFARQIDA